MKIALIGNMNNNNFSIMRYLRDLGEDAHLFLWANDGVGTLAHFNPEFDCQNINKWRPYIHQTKLVNGYNSLLPNPRKLKLAPSIKYIKELFSEFNFFIGSGLSPAILQRANIKLDIFSPYGSGIEFVGLGINRTMLRDPFSIRKVVFKFVRERQIIAIKKARYCLNSEIGITAETFKEINCEFLPIQSPIVYNRENIIDYTPSLNLSDFINAREVNDLVVFSHASHMWIKKDNYSQFEWSRASKHNDWLVIGFSQFIKTNRFKKAKLVLIDYGNDAHHTRKLCVDLGIDKHVLWLSKLPRKDIMFVLSKCDLGVGEFAVSPGSIWGGTGWEVLASGKPLLQTFNFTTNQFQSIFGHEPPAILDVKCSEDVTNYLLDWCDNKSKYTEIGENGKKWFNNYNGIGLAQKWLDLLKLPKGTL